jgi:hypothetical protein
MSRAYLCVSIDTECDQGPAWRALRPLSFDGVRVGIRDRLQPLFASFGAKPTYLVASEVLGDARCLEELRAISASCELGTHLHEEALSTAGGYADAAVERRELTQVTDQFIRAFDYQPLAFRAGTSGLRRSTIGFLEDLGYLVESSVTPNVPTASPTQPYRVDREDPSRRGDSTILEIPITIRKAAWSWLPGSARLFPPRWLRPTFTPEDELVRIAEDEIAEARQHAPGRPVFLNAVLNAAEVVPARTRHASFEMDCRRILDRLGALLAFAREESISVIGLGDVPEILRA